MDNLFFEKIFRRFFMGLDSVLFNFISTLYNLLIEIARSSILSQGEIARLAQRVELLLGIFMLFKMSFSLITYIVNPDDFSDKQKGFGKLIQGAVISLLMLVLVPYAFQMAFNLQSKVLEGNILGKLIMGEDTGSDGYLNSAGDDMAFNVMMPFFLPNTGMKAYDLSSCITIYNSDGKFNGECKKALEESGVNDVILDNYETGINEHSLGLTFRSSMAVATGNTKDEFIIDYKTFISTAVAVVVCLLLITFCIDIGVRSVKLAFLQLIYPIPVISYMDPKSGKDGLFNKWLKMCASTFISLFVRLLALYFGVYIIYRVGKFGIYDVVTGAQKNNFWIQVFIIVGVLMFIKQLPKILENMGIKLDGEGKFTLNPLKKVEEGALGGKLLHKPNEMISKGVKGIAKAPVSAIGTFGKKGFAAIDSMRTGRGFRAGWSSKHGNLSEAFRKKKDELMPYSAEKRKQQIEGRNEFDQKHKLWAKGRNAWEKVKGDTKAFSVDEKDSSFENFAQRTNDNYNSVYNNKGFIASKQRLEYVDNKLKDVQKQYETSEGEQKQQFYKAYHDLSKAKESAQKDHDIMRKRYIDDAETEDALSYTKSTQRIKQTETSEGEFVVKNDNTAHDATSIHRQRNYQFKDNDEGNKRGNDRP